MCPKVSVEVTVVVPTRNRWPLLRDHALANALGQADVALEVIVVDDASTDETAERLAALSDERVRVIRHATRQNRTKARNSGLAAARGEWIAFLDDDDLWSPRMLRTLLDTAAHTGASFVYSAVLLVDAGLRVLEKVAAPDPEDLRAALLRRCVIQSPSAVVTKADVLRQVEGFDENLAELEDWDLWIRVSAVASAAACQEALAAYLVHDANTRVTDEADVFAALAYVLEKHAAARESWGVAFHAAEFARYVASSDLRAGRRRRAVSVFMRSARADRNLGNAVRALLALTGRHALTMRHIRKAIAAGPEPTWLAHRRRLLSDVAATPQETNGH